MNINNAMLLKEVERRMNNDIVCSILTDVELLQEIAKRLARKETHYRLTAIELPKSGQEVRVLHMDTFTDFAMPAITQENKDNGRLELKFKPEANVGTEDTAEFCPREFGIWCDEAFFN